MQASREVFRLLTDASGWWKHKSDDKTPTCYAGSISIYTAAAGIPYGRIFRHGFTVSVFVLSFALRGEQGIFRCLLSYIVAMTSKG